MDLILVCYFLRSWCLKLSVGVLTLVGGGFFTGTIKKDTVVEPGSRFDPNRNQGKVIFVLTSTHGDRFNQIICAQSYRARYWNDQYFEAIEIIQTVAAKHELTMAEVALRWVSHHSLMKRYVAFRSPSLVMVSPWHKTILMTHIREYGDAIIIGASSLKHIEQNLSDLEKGPLREY
jgi:aflatoxin B1 aldehyde reductase